MLYKKYHRNFVKQFKVRAVFGTTRAMYRYIVEEEPYYDGVFKGIRITSDKGNFNLVYPGGEINKHLYVV